ncbi:MAG TPA: hypothetical protein VGB17_11590 [Pyrinomonadaceae bacterium]
MTRRVIVVDGANVAYEECSEGGCPKVSNLLAVRQALEEKGYDPIIIVDASLKHRIDDPDQLEKLIQQQTVRQTPAGTDADYFVLEIAAQNDALVITNDRYRDYQEQYPWIEERRVPLMIIGGQVQLYEKPCELD